MTVEKVASILLVLTMQAAAWPQTSSFPPQENQLQLVHDDAQREILPTKANESLRIATFNVSLNRRNAGQLSMDLARGNAQISALARVIRLVQPDILLLNEIDYDAAADNAGKFQERYLNSPENDEFLSGPWNMPFQYSASVNTGVPSGLDLNVNGRTGEPDDAWGYGAFPGQYGMAILSRFPIEQEAARTFQHLLWSSMPSASLPKAPDQEEPFYDMATWKQLRLSSKSFWDVPILTPQGTIHVLASHPTPPAFDGPEDRNGCRNHDEIKLISDYIHSADYLRDDQGRPGGLEESAHFVVLGDLNSDPNDGGSRTSAITALLKDSRIAQVAAPRSVGGKMAAERQGEANQQHAGPPEEDTADFNDRSVGNLRADYALASSNCKVIQSGVFWPALESVAPEQRTALLESLRASDHHLVWIDVQLHNGKSTSSND
ncbi:MAG: endonuclease/exonuclease/phosphatase family protein [Planctomycetales bacterium]|nr:endonuclease/exonuclease/phosphatase family protein [Planctomycetales bacterium]